MFGMKRINLKRINMRGMDSAMVKIIFVTVSLVLVSIALKSAYAGYLGTQTTVSVAGASMSPEQAIGNLTKTIAQNV